MRKYIIRICQAVVIATVLSAILLASAYAATWFTCDGNTLCGLGVSNYYGVADTASGQSSPVGVANVWRVSFPAETPGGQGEANIWFPAPPGGSQEMWVQYWYKYSSGFSYHPANNKQFMFTPSNTLGMGINQDSGVDMVPQGPYSDTKWPNQGASVGGDTLWYVHQTGTWHKYKGHYKLNTATNVWDGIYQAWIDDVMVANYSTVYYADGGNSLGSQGMVVIWGGTGGAVPATQYLYFAGIYYGSTDPGGSTVVDQTPPYVYGASPAEGSSGNVKTNRAISAHVADGGASVSGVLRSSVTMGVSINGGVYTSYAYGTGLTFSPNNTNSADFTITRTMGADWSDGDQVSVVINATDAAGNVMPPHSYTFQMTAVSNSYSTSFITPESVLHENTGSGNRWINGGDVGGPWHNVIVSGGNAYGESTPHLPQYVDPVAILTGGWSPDQSIEGVVYSLNQRNDYWQEVELRLRSTLTTDAHYYGYEINFRCLNTSEAYMQIAKWPGYLPTNINEWTFFFDGHGSQYGVVDGDTVKAEIIGNQIKVWKNGVLLASVTDPNPISIGNPGIGMNYGSDATNVDFGFKSIVATGIITNPISISTTSLPNGTVGTAYLQQLAATGGTSPYTWSVITGSLPAGLGLSTSGVISGTPTTAGTASFTIHASDVNAVTGNQALSITVAPLLPGGQTVVTGTITTFTHTNSGAATTNYLGTAEVYQWPAATVANRTYLQDNTAKGLPNNISITAATLRGRVSSLEGSGGTVPMRVHAYNVTDNIPTLSTVTWNNDNSTRTELAVADVPLATGWITWNVLTSAQAAKAGNATMTLALDGGSDGASDTNRIFDQFEIVITYTQLVGPGGPSISAPGKARVTKARWNHFR